MSETVAADADRDIRPVGGPEIGTEHAFQFCLEKNILGISGCKFCSGLTPGLRNYDLEPGSAKDPRKIERCDEERLLGGLGAHP
jgi:hypothetical protein